MTALDRSLQRAVPATARERTAAVWSFAYFFALLAGCGVFAATPVTRPKPAPPRSSEQRTAEALARRLRALARDADPALDEGVYAALPGPHYETPAEIRLLRTAGADLVGPGQLHVVESVDDRETNRHQDWRRRRLPGNRRAKPWKVLCPRIRLI